MTLIDGKPAGGAGDTGTPPGASGTPPAGDWTIPEDMRGTFKSGREFAVGYKNLERLLGGEKVPIPRDDNDVEAWNHFFRAAGRPDTAELYELTKPEQMPDGISWDTDMESWWRQAAHKSGLSKRQFTQLVENYRDRIFSGHELARAAAREEVTQAETVLRRDWGAKYELRLQMATAEFESLPEDIQIRLRQAGLNRNAGFIKWLADSKARVTGELEPKTPGGRHAMRTPEQLEAEIADIRERHSKVLMNKSHPEHQMRVKQLTELYQALYPEPKAE